MGLYLVCCSVAESESVVGVEGVEGFYGNSESESKKEFCRSRESEWIGNKSRESESDSN